MLHDRTALLTGIGIGAGLFFFLDPNRGRRRRALVSDQLTHAKRVARSAFAGDVVDDDVLTERIRTRLGRLVSHPRAIDVIVENGVVILRGPVLRRERARLLSGLERIRGVRELMPDLDEHESPRNVPSLQRGQGKTARSGQWPPAVRAAASSAALAMAGYGRAKGGRAGALLMAAAFALVTRAATR